ncbi:MarR family winged helix-turn-helix transcriptional regulator [Variovorax sp.]|uniref:MarR family winged helix-turn-helix transcriptional regulator n=1 Tax=Variovorax sp. TaxID=1871043 RepID=UPI002D6BFCDA|nr:MarR family winged helix-turn-helix transcriptional regulator [Variovorax sp.]HYP83792.1 MarR family winged helix-turn-helix transcriptional regulator [Variovorax sp.]
MNNPRHASSVPDAPVRRGSTGTEAPPRRFVEDYLAALLAQASHLISSEFHEVARRHGFSVSEWRVMASLAGGAAISIGQLAQVSVMKQPTVTRMLDRMAAKGHVERLPHESDRRITLVRITDAGERTVGHLMELAREHERRVLEPFGLQSAEALKDTLRRMIELHQHAPDAGGGSDGEDDEPGSAA